MKKIIKEVFLFIFIVAVLCSCAYNSSNSSQIGLATNSNREESNLSLAEETKAKYAPEEFGYKLYDVSEADFSASDIDKMSISFSANYILTKSRDIYVWGLNEGGALGIGAPGNAMLLMPAKIDIGEPVKKLSVSKNGNSVAALGESGTLYVWGWNTLGQFPEIEDAFVYTPKKINFEKEIKDISISQTNLLIYTTDEEIYITNFGVYNFDEALEKNLEKESIESKSGFCYVGKLKGVSKIDSAYGHFIFLTEAKEVYALGRISEKSEFPYFATPQKIDLQEKAVDTGAMEDGIVILSENGTLYYMGYDKSGIQDERVDITDENYYETEFNILEKPTPIHKVESKVKAFSLSASSIIMRDENDKFYTWGYNIGHVDAETDDNTVFKPTEILLPENTTSMCIGEFSGIAKTEDEKVYAWGSGYYCIYMEDTYAKSHIPRELIFKK